MNPQYEKLTVLSIDGKHYLCKCECGNIVILTQEELTKEGCGAACSVSRGEVCAADIFNELNVNYQVQKKFDDFDMKFDFYLPNYRIAIECDGAQHFRSINSEWDSENKLQETRARDLAKQNYCKKHNITLLQIPFWDHTALSVENLKKVIADA